MAVLLRYDVIGHGGQPRTVVPPSDFDFTDLPAARDKKIAKNSYETIVPKLCNVLN